MKTEDAIRRGIERIDREIMEMHRVAGTAPPEESAAPEQFVTVDHEAIFALRSAKAALEWALGLDATHDEEGLHLIREMLDDA